MSVNDKFILGLDIGASSVKYGWGDCQRGLHYISKRELTSRDLTSLKQTIVDIIAEISSTPLWPNLRAIGIGTPGTLDLQTGKITGVNPNLPFWTDIDPRSLVPPSLAIPVFAENDANLMCLAEAWLRPSTGLTVGVTVGSGIGCGLAMDGKVFRGAHGFAMELGHLTVVPDGALCSCGRKGCVEAYASVEGIRNRIRSLGETDRAALAGQDLKTLIEMADRDPQIASIITEGLDGLSLGLANLVVLLDPDLIVMGGGAMDAGLYDLQCLKDKITCLLPVANQPKLRLENALEGNRAGVLGAIILASQSIS